MAKKSKASKASKPPLQIPGSTNKPGGPQRIGPLRDNINPLKPKAGFYGSVAGFGMGSGYGMPMAEQYGAPAAKDLSLPPSNVNDSLVKHGHIKPAAQSVKPKSRKG